MSKSASKSIENSVKTALNLIPRKTPKVILGVSGGPDSMALLYAFFKAEVEVIVVHINYDMRGKESDLDQELVEGMCIAWGFECYSIKLDYEEREGNFQNWGRKERYRIFKELKKVNKADCIATAHHQNDQIETILQKLLRGSGTNAWQGMRVWDGQLFRPLLEFSKSEILNYCKKEAIPFRVDESNLESRYARNFIRNELEEKFDGLFPGWRTNILDLPEKGMLTDLAVQHILDGMLEEEGLEISKFAQLNALLKPIVLKKFIALKIPELSISKGKLSELLEIEKAQVGTSIPVLNMVFLIRDRACITIQKKGSKNFALEFNEEQAKEGIQSNNIEISISNEINNPDSLYIDASSIKWPLTLRNWKKADKFVPFGMKGSQKISDHLTNRKIPASKKEKALILSDVDSTIYAIIFLVKANNGEIGTISEIIKCTEHTTEYLTINLK